jgi:hypothetical protein
MNIATDSQKNDQIYHIFREDGLGKYPFSVYGYILPSLKDGRKSSGQRSFIGQGDKNHGHLQAWRRVVCTL